MTLAQQLRMKLGINPYSNNSYPNYSYRKKGPGRIHLHLSVSERKEKERYKRIFTQDYKVDLNV